jgi:uracil-DNA glycosylase
LEARHPEVFGEWLDEAIENIKPTMIIAVGATAASCGSAAKVTRERGRFFESTLAPLLSVTVHPS